MPEIITKDDGSQVTVYSEEEIATQKQQAIDEYKAQNPDKTEDVQRLQTELEEAKKSLAGLKDKDINVGILRQGFEKKIGELEKTLETKIGEAKEVTKKEVLDGVMKDFYNDEITRKASGDDELKKKIEFHYNRLSDPTATKEDVAKKMEDAYKLATVGQESANMSAFSSAGASAPKIKESVLTEDDKDLLRKMGKGHLVK